MMKVGGSNTGGPAGDKDRLYKNLEALQDAADDAGIRLTVDDGLDWLRHKLTCIEKPELSKFRVRVIPPGVDLVRLDPGGECATGLGVLRRLTPFTPRWNPAKEEAVAFLERVTDTASQDDQTADRRVTAFRPPLKHGVDVFGSYAPLAESSASLATGARSP